MYRMLIILTALFVSYLWPLPALAQEEDLEPSLRNAVNAFHAELNNEDLKTKVMRIRLWSLNGLQYATLAVLHKHVSDCPPDVDCSGSRHLVESMTELEGPTPPGIYDWNSLTGKESYTHIVALQAALRGGKWIVHTAPEGILMDEPYMKKAHTAAEEISSGLTFTNHTL